MTLTSQSAAATGLRRVTKSSADPTATSANR